MKIEDKLVASVISGLKALYSQEVPEKMVQIQKTKKEFVPQQAFALILKYLNQGSDPPLPARRRLRNPDRSDRGTWGPVPD